MRKTIRLRPIWLLFAFVALVGVRGVARGQEVAETPEAVKEGKKVYMNRCYYCHGKEGDGNGPVADFLYPRPRDFTSGLYKFRTTASGEAPQDEDLFAILTRGLPGTAMQSFASIPAKERWQVIYYLKSFAPEYFDPEYPPVVVEIGNPPPPSEELIVKGKELYQKVKCWECHGQEGRGDGPSARELTDDWENAILPADLTKGWQYRGGSSAEEIYRTFTTGINGTPMPSFVDTLSEEERWALAYYVHSLARPAPGAEVVLRAKELREEIPLSADARLWEEVPFLDLPLSGQVIVAPRWQNPSVDMIRLRSVYNDKEVGFLLEWDDRFKNTAHDGPDEPAGQEKEGAYAKVDYRMIGQWPYRDAVATQFPVQLPAGPEKPYFYRGEAGKPVNLWKWNADWQEEGWEQVVEEQTAAGFAAEVRPQPEGSQGVRGHGVFRDGQWRVVMIRSLTTADAANDVQFTAGKFIPFAIHVWDGANGEVGRKCSISSWYYVFMAPATPWRVYVYAVLGVVMAAVGEGWLLKRVKRS